MAELYNELKKDHLRVKELFNRISSESLFKEYFPILKKEIEMHTMAEERFFYPAFKDYSELKKIIKKALSDHRKVNRRINSLSRNSRNWPEKIDELRRMVMEHVNLEELQIFQISSNLVSEEQMKDIANNFIQFKESMKQVLI